MPEGPVRLEALLKNSVIISWKAPKDDGGSMITNYIVERREDKEGDEWQLVSSSITGTSCRIPNLIENAGYHFRVSAQNKYGNSEALETPAPILIKSQLGKFSQMSLLKSNYKTTRNSVSRMPSLYIYMSVFYSFTEKPGAPLSVSVAGITKNSCVVSWRPPLSDGGSKIKTYYLEKRDKKKGEWVNVTTDEIHQTVFSVKGLTEGVEYDFRVKCENLGGESEWSEVSPSIIPKTHVDVRAPAFKEELRNMSVRYKSNATLVCKITGQPKPVVKWFRRGKEIQSDGKKIKVQEFKGGYHQLVITAADEEDSTVYQIRATNQGGSICATVSLDVEGKSIKCIQSIKLINQTASC